MILRYVATITRKFGYVITNSPGSKFKFIAKNVRSRSAQRHHTDPIAVAVQICMHDE